MAHQQHNIFSTYILTPEEQLSADILSTTQKQKLGNLLAEFTLLNANQPIDLELEGELAVRKLAVERSYQQGKIELIRELLRDSDIAEDVANKIRASQPKE